MLLTPRHDAPALRAAFDAPAPMTVGLEEEVWLLDPETLDLLPRAEEVVARAGQPERFKLEMPAAQLEIVTAPARSVGDAVAELAAGRRELAAAAEGIGRPAGGALHPFAEPRGVIRKAAHYGAMLAEYGDVARRELVGALQVHVAVGSADGTLAVYRVLRGLLPELAALAANAPFHDGRDTGLASARPKLAEALPRQGVPPVIESWESLADDFAWGARSGRVPSPAQWWWELRPHVAHGTLELRVPDAQITVADAAAVAAYAHCLVAWIAERAEAGEPGVDAPGWRIAENRWAACRHGVDGGFADYATGAVRPLRELILERAEALAPLAVRLGCADELALVPGLVAAPGAARQREVARDAGLHGLMAWMAGEFLAGVPERPRAAGVVPGGARG